MPPTSQIYECQRFAQSVASAGGTLPTSLGHLLRSHELLTSPAAAGDPANAILDAAADGTLDEKLLDKLLPAAAAADSANDYRQKLASRAERMLVSKWYRLSRPAPQTEVLDSMRPEFDRHAAGIAEAKAAGINAESSLEHLVSSSSGPGLVEAWNDLGGHIRVIAAIASVAAHSAPGRAARSHRSRSSPPVTRICSTIGP